MIPHLGKVHAPGVEIGKLEPKHRKRKSFFAFLISVLTDENQCSKILNITRYCLSSNRVVFVGIEIVSFDNFDYPILALQCIH